MAIIASLPREGRVMRQVRRCFVAAGGKPLGIIWETGDDKPPFPAALVSRGQRGQKLACSPFHQEDQS
jgi:hypothetical protein